MTALKTAIGSQSAATETAFTPRTAVPRSNAQAALEYLADTLVIGTTVQAWDADLDAIAALAATGIAVRTAANTWAQRQIAVPAAGLSITNPAGVAGNPTLALANDLAALEGLASTGFAVRSATDTWVQRTLANAAAGITWTNGDGIAGNPTPVLANDLAALEGLASTGFATRTATDTWTVRTIVGTSNEISVAAGGGSAGNPTLSLPTALTFTGKTVTGGTFASPAAITGLPDPTNAQDVATKAYVDTVAQGLDPKPSVKCATTANITLSGEQTLDGVTTSTSRVLVKSQSTASQNGIYVSASGSWTRATDMDVWTEVPGAFVFVEEGTVNADTGWVCTSNSGGTIGSTSMAWTQFCGAGTYTAGTGLSLTGTQFAISDAELLAIAGLTSAADKVPYFTGSGTAALADFSSFGRTLVDDASARAACATLGSWYVLGTGNTTVSHTGDTAEFTLATVTIPANAMGANGRVRITVIWTFTNSVNTKTLRVRFDGTSGTQYLALTPTTNATLRSQTEIANRNNTALQVGAPSALGSGGWGPVTTGITTSSVDTTAAVDIVISCQNSNSGETIGIASYLVELYSV